MISLAGKTSTLRQWLLFTIRRAPYMLFMLVCLCVALALTFSVVTIFGSVDSDAGQFDVGWQFSPVDWSAISMATAASILILVALCFVLPTLPVLWGFLILAGSAAAIAAIQFFLALSFADAIVRFAVITVVVTCAYLLVIATLGWLRLRRENRYLQRYAPSQVVDHYLSLPTDRSAGGLQDMTIMFCDIKSFTGISERLDPEQLPGWLNRFFDVVCEIVTRHGGTIDKYIGDSVMAFWGAPTHSDSHARDALMAAKEIIPAVRALSKKLEAEGSPAMAVGIGLSTGKAYVGNLGSRDRMTYTVVGDAVNTADRLQRCTGVYNLSIVVNDRMTEQVPDYLFRELDTVHVKGRQRFVRIFQPVCQEDEATPNTYRRLQMHRKAMQFYRRGMWADAEKLFRALGDDASEYAFYRRYVKRLVNIRQSDSSADTSFVIDFTQKIG